MGSSKKGQPKKVSVGKLPVNGKGPRRAIEPTSYYSERPSWRISQIEMMDPFGWHRIDPTSALYVREKLSQFESMTWSEILIDAKKQNHSISVSDLCKAARDRLEAIQQEDVDELVSLRLSGRERVWGILEGGVLRLLWWDPEHQVCPSVLKNT